MQNFNYHCHTIFSDGRREAEAYIQEAIQKEFEIIGFSDHAPIPGYSTRWNMEMEQLDEYFAEIDALKNKYAEQIRVRTSMEVDFVEGYIHPLSGEVKTEQLDYIIGSVHFLISEDGTLWDYEGNPARIQQGVEELFHGDVRSMITQYYDNIRKMVRDYTPDIIGHLDRIKVLNDKGNYFDETAGWYQKEIEKTLEAIQGTKAIMEVNTKGIYGKGYTDPYPSYWIIDMARSMDIPVVLSSDAHAPEWLAGAFDEVQSKLEKVGYSREHDNGKLRYYL